MTTRCSFFFGGGHEHCCREHDDMYAATSEVPRHRADLYLLQCACAVGRPWRGIAMFIGVRLFGWIFYKGGA